MVWQQNEKEEPRWGENLHTWLAAVLKVGLKVGFTAQQALRHCLQPAHKADPQTNIRRNYLRESCQNSLITFSLSNGRSWPFMREGLCSSPQVQRLLLAPELTFSSKKKIRMGKSSAGKAVIDP